MILRPDFRSLAAGFAVSAVLFGALAPLSAEARTVTGRRGGTASVSITQSGTSATGSVSATSASGATASGSGSVTYHPRTGTVDGSGSMTGPTGETHGGTVEAGNGSATATGNNGQTHSWTRPQ